jgi:hypothetical protein
VGDRNRRTPFDPKGVTSGTLAAELPKGREWERTGADGPRPWVERLGRGPARGPPPGRDPIGTDPAAPEPPPLPRAFELVPVPAPVVHAAVGHGQEVAPGPGPLGPVELDHDVVDVVANARGPRVGGKIPTGARDERSDRVPAAVGRFPLDLEDAVGHEQLDEIVESASVDAMGVPGDGVADLFSSRKLPRVHEVSLVPRIA